MSGSDSGSGSGSDERSETSSLSYSKIVEHENYVEKCLVSEMHFPYIIREIAALKLLDAAKVPNIVPLISITPDAGICLAKFKGDIHVYPPNKLEDIYNMTYDILVAMENMLQLHIVQRDIKPENILIDDAGNIVLCDFGLARYLPDLEVPDHTTDNVQTYPYRAPELLFRDLDLDNYSGFNPRTLDVWSLGITLLTVLNQTDLLADISDLSTEEGEQVYQKLYGGDMFDDDAMEYACECGINEEFMCLIKRMLTLDYKDRPEPLDLLFDDFYFSFGRDDVSFGRDDGGVSLIDGMEFNALRAALCIDELKRAIPKINKNGKFMKSINRYDFMNKHAQSLAVLMFCKLLNMGKLTNKQLMTDTIINIAMAVYDNELIVVDKELGIKILTDLNYDLFQPINDIEVTQLIGSILT